MTDSEEGEGGGEEVKVGGGADVDVAEFNADNGSSNGDQNKSSQKRDDDESVKCTGARGS